MSDKKAKNSQPDDIESILGKIDALISVSGNTEDIISKITPLPASVTEEMSADDFVDAQLQEISKGMEQNLPTSVYAKTCFNWMQMYEIRLGLLDGLDVEIYADPLFSSSQMREIRLGLLDHLDVSSYAKLVLSATDMRRLRKALFAGAYKKKSKHFGRTEIDEETGITIRISDDCMSAFIKLPENLPDSYSEWDLQNTLRDHEITYGINEDQLQKLLTERPVNEEICIAHGKAPTTGKSGWYEFFFKNSIENSRVLMPDEEIDYSDVKLIDAVTVDALLAKYHPAQKNTGGMTVTEIPVDGIAGEDLPRLTGHGIRYDAEQRTYIATENGYPSYSSITSSLNVWNIFEVSGNLNCYQSLEYDGIVHVAGSVYSAAVIRAKGDIIIDGFVEGAYISSSQNIIIKGGVNAGSQGTISAGGFVHGKFFENAVVHAGGNVEGNYFLNCNINTDTSLIARGRKARIMGGTITAAISVEAVIIGNYYSSKTIFTVGDLDSLEKRISDLQQLNKKASDELYQLTAGKQKLLMLLGEEASQNNSLYTKTCAALTVKESQVSEYSGEILRLEAVMRRAEKAYVRVHDELQEHVVFIINGNKKRIEKKVTRGIVLTSRKAKEK